MNTDTFKQLLKQRLDNAGFEDHENTVRKKTVLGVTTCRGRERWVRGTTGISEVEVQQEGEGFDLKFIATAKVPYSASYEAKNFIGVGCEWRGDDKSCGGTLQFQYERTFFGSAVNDLALLDASPAGHDATRMCQEAIVEDVIATLDNLI